MRLARHRDSPWRGYGFLPPTLLGVEPNQRIHPARPVAVTGALAHSLQRQHLTLHLRHPSGPLRTACHDLGLAGLLLGPADQGAAA